MKLLIGNRNYSSWSLRAWLVLRHFGLSFEEEQLLLSGPGWKSRLLERSPSGRVPVLIDEDLVIPETLAIIEYIAERHPEHPVWPQDARMRALARSASAEMHAGFPRLRNTAPMNLRSHLPGRVSFEMVEGDLKRIENIWSGLLQRSGGPYLCGAFSAVDAMFAPVATRIRTYELSVPDVVSEYVEAIYALPAFQEWLAAARREPWVVEEDEIDFIQGRPH